MVLDAAVRAHLASQDSATLLALLPVLKLEADSVLREIRLVEEGTKDGAVADGMVAEQVNMARAAWLIRVGDAEKFPEAVKAAFTALERMRDESASDPDATGRYMNQLSTLISDLFARQEFIKDELRKRRLLPDLPWSTP